MNDKLIEISEMEWDDWMRQYIDALEDYKRRLEADIEARLQELEKLYPSLKK